MEKGPYAGIDNTSTLNFTTSASDPSLNESNPYNFQENYQADGSITLTFDESVSAGDGNITISNGFDIRLIAVGDTSQVTFEENVVTINPAADLIVDKHYTVQVPDSAIVDTAGNPYAGFNEANALKFSTTFSSDPKLAYSIPSNGGTEFQID